MKVAVDARFVGTPGGIGRYVEELLRAMVAEADDIKFALFLRKNAGGRFANLARVQEIVAEVPWYTLREQIAMPGLVKKTQPDLVHWTHWNVPLVPVTPFVVTIHDLILLDYPSVRATTLGPLAYRIKNAAFRIVISEAVKKARVIITPTEYVRQRLIERFGVSEERVAVTSEGLTALPAVSAEGMASGLERLGVRQPYLLSVGNAYPHKNLDGLLEAFALVRARRPEFSLVIAGYDDYFFRRLRREAASRGQDQGVVFVPSPADSVLSTLYGGARAFVAPAFIEGFGLPALEAMRAGAPVASSNGGALPEVLGDAAKFFDPGKIEEMADAIMKTIEDDAMRQTLIIKGKERISRYGWRETGRKTLEVYREALRTK